MAGGLIHIVSSCSSGSLYLTGAPQITFYKMVYRRYTNFAMESVYLNIDNGVYFNTEMEIKFERIGDLMHKGYLHINIPKMSISKQDVGIDTTDIRLDYRDKTVVIEYEKICNVYMKILTDIYRIVFNAVNASNVTYADLVQDVQDYVGNNNIEDMLAEYDKFITNKKHELINRYNNTDDLNDKNFLDNISLLNSDRSNLWHILTNIHPNKLFSIATNSIDIPEDTNSDDYAKEIQCIMKKTAFKEIQKGLEVCKSTQKYFFEQYKKFIASTSTDRCDNIKCAWVKNLGHSIIDYIDVYIGGKRIDRHLGIWINIWYQLTYKQAQINTYNDMIGNIASLTNFDAQEKPAYDIYVPLSFWFNKFNGLSFPLIAMQYNDISFTIKLRNFEEVFYIERIYRAELNGNTIVLTADTIDFIQNRSKDKHKLELTNIEEVRDISLADIWESKGLCLYGHVVMDYIYLESAERQRFAKSGHEYLIELIQCNDFAHIEQTQFDVQLDFTGPSKEIIWAFLKETNTSNQYGWNACKWYDHSTGIQNNGSPRNPVLNAKLEFDTYTRIDKQIGMYFDVYQPMVYHDTSPTPGINLYSFCIDPKQHQATGSCNFTRLSNVKLFMDISKELFVYTDADVYPHDLNIDFKINIVDPSALMETMDINYAKSIVRVYSKDNLDRIDIPIDDAYDLLDKAYTTLDIHEHLSSGESIEVCMKNYRKILFKTTSQFYVFDLSMNILRLFGGYGALAYASNK